MTIPGTMRRLRRPILAIALFAAGLLTAAGATTPAHAQYYPYYPYYYPYYAAYCNAYYYPYGCPASPYNYTYPNYYNYAPFAVGLGLGSGFGFHHHHHRFFRGGGFHGGFHRR